MSHRRATPPPWCRQPSPARDGHRGDPEGPAGTSTSRSSGRPRSLRGDRRGAARLAVAIPGRLGELRGEHVHPTQGDITTLGGTTRCSTIGCHEVRHEAENVHHRDQGGAKPTPLKKPVSTYHWSSAFTNGAGPATGCAVVVGVQPAAGRRSHADCQDDAQGRGIWACSARRLSAWGPYRQAKLLLAGAHQPANAALLLHGCCGVRTDQRCRYAQSPA